MIVGGSPLLQQGGGALEHLRGRSPSDSMGFSPGLPWPPRLKPEEYSRALEPLAKLESRAPPHKCRGCHQIAKHSTRSISSCLGLPSETVLLLA